MILSESRALSYKLENSKILPLKKWISPNFFSTNKKFRANEKFAVQFHQQLTLQILRFNFAHFLPNTVCHLPNLCAE